MKYRKDRRSVAQFRKDIQESSQIEQELMEVYVSDLSKRRGVKYTFKDNGCDNTGKLLEDRNVTTDPDFLLITPSGIKHKIEIKFSRPDKEDFHLKDDQLKAMYRHDCCLIMFMGIDTPNRRYCVIKPDKFMEILEKAPKKVIWSKDARRLLVKDFEWFSC